jgi:type VI secretion system secreted protein VgrG
MVGVLKQDKRIAALRTPLGEDALVISRFDGGEGLSELFEYRLEALSLDGKLDFDQGIGQHCTVTFRTHGGRERHFDGILSEAQSLGKKLAGKDTIYAYRLVLKSWLWMLSRTSDCRDFHNKDVKEIVKKVFEDRGFTDFTQANLKESYPQIEYCVQYRETDLAFVSRLMEQYGIYYFFIHEPGKHTMVLADSKSSHDPIPGNETIKFVPLTDHTLQEDDLIYRLSSERRFRTGKVALNDYDEENPNTKLLLDVTGREQYTRSTMEHYDYPGKYTDTGLGERFAKIRLEAEQALDHRRNCAGDAVGVFPGGWFKLARHTNPDENLEYLVVRASHSFVGQNYHADEGDDSQETYFGNYELQPLDRPFRAPLLTERPVVHGPQTAKVVAGKGKEGEEIDVDDLGRILVHFYWNRGKTPSCRVRIGQVWSGKNWGGIFIPRIGQEVIVEYLEGDPDRPIVVGTVYNGENMPPYPLPNEQNIGGLKSNSTKGGNGYNEWVFDDTKGSELVRGQAEKDLNWLVKNDEERTINHDLTVDVGNIVTVTAGMKIELKVGASNIVIDNSGITMKGVAILNADSPMTTVNGSAIMTVTGGLVKIN